MNDLKRLKKYVRSLDAPLVQPDGRISTTGRTVLRMLERDAAEACLMPRGYRMKAELELAADRLDAAVESYRASVSRNPISAESLAALLSALLRAGDFRKANQTYEALQEHTEPGFLTAERALSLLSAALEAGTFGDLESAAFAELFFVPALVDSNGNSNQPFMKSLSRQFTETHLEDLLAYADAYVRNSGGTFYYVSIDTLFHVRNRTPAEEAILDEELWSPKRGRTAWLKSGPEHIRNMYCELDPYGPDYLRNIFSGPGNAILATRVVMTDYASDFVNVCQHRRRTLPEVEAYDNKILLLGASDVYGFGCEDKHTIASFLQQLLQDTPAAGTTYRVENHGVRGNPLLLCLSNLTQTAVQPGDVVIMFGYPRPDPAQTALPPDRVMHCDLSRPHDRGEIFFDHNHPGWRGSKWIAEMLQDMLSADRADPGGPAAAVPKIAQAAVELTKYLVFKSFSAHAEAQGIDQYLGYLRAEKVRVPGRIGSIAVNCNPITLGHLHLIEYAAGQVDWLYLFVIEEDQSFFSFEDRFRLVSEATRHLENVKVLKGGRYICTEFTYPEYSSKDDVQNVAADASMEAWFFCEFIARALEISVTFLGEEPNCRITRQYNSKMAEILPGFGIEVDVIPRISRNGQAISASTVRRLLQAGQFDAIAEIVPACTHRYLLESHRGTSPA